MSISYRMSQLPAQSKCCPTDSDCIQKTTLHSWHKISPKPGGCLPNFDVISTLKSG